MVKHVTELFVDLLFYHLKLRGYVVTEYALGDITQPMGIEPRVQGR